MERSGKVTVVGAGFYGSTTAQRLAEYDIFDEVVLTDIIDGKPEGLALDMNQSRPIQGFETVVTGQTTTLAVQTTQLAALQASNATVFAALLSQGATVATQTASSAIIHGVLRSVPLPMPCRVAAIQTAKLA